MKKLYCLTCYVLVFIVGFSQSAPVVTGYVYSSEGKSVAYASVTVMHTKHSVMADENGFFKLPLPNGKYELRVSSIGFEAKRIVIVVDENTAKPLRITLSHQDAELDSVLVQGKTAIQNVRESAYNVVAVDAKSLYNTSLDLAHVLDRASGVKIRESGGVGSGMSVSLNGFTGRHVKVFLDGVPMEGFGSAFQLNNIPVGIADRIEVYKGVVPIEFGGDAMGGVINIVTKKAARSYLDISYSYGSFNTHRTNIDAGYTGKNGFTAQLNAFQNYSDNSYKVYTQVLNLQTNTYSQDSQWVRRFHDTYHNETVIGKIGFVKKKWADRLLFGVTLGKEKADIQQAYIMRIVYGAKWRDATTVIPSLTYSKHNFLVKKLNLNVTATYNRNLNHNYDTASRQYNWLGEYRVKATQGEGLSTMSEYVNQNGSVIANLTYQPTHKHIFSVNEVLTTFRRKMTDAAIAVDNSVSAADTMKRRQAKNVLAASYRYQHNKHWNTTLFAKYYSQSVTGPVDTSVVASSEKWAQKNTVYTTAGYGVAATYLLYESWQLKASYEKAYRLPTETELFGDGVLEVGDAAIKAEYSNNYNFGITYNRQFHSVHGVYADVSFMYRDINDYIRREVNDQRYGSAYYYNHGRVSNTGINAEVKYFYKQLFSIGGNITYQNLINQEKYKANSSVLSTTYKDRVPNVPYLFGSTDVSLYLHNVVSKGDVLTASHMMQYTHEFYIDWPSQGSADSKDKLPTQIAHDFFLTYVMKNGRYNVSFEARNFTNALLYDNFSLQKPGRAFYVKLRYYLSGTKR